MGPDVWKGEVSVRGDVQRGEMSVFRVFDYQQ